MTTILTISLVINILTITAIMSMSRSHFGTLSPVATRLLLRALSILRVPVSVVVYDIRKMHELNAVMGYANSNILVARLTKVRQSDIIGQYGGDEFVVISRPGAGSRIAWRIIEKAKEITAQIDPAKRDALNLRTGGIVDGLTVAITYSNYSTNALRDTVRGVDETERLKEHNASMTGNRATTGNAGTLISEME